MPRRKEVFENGEIYHLTVKRIGDELLFKNVDDYYRGIFSIYEFNTTDLVTIRERRKIRAQMKRTRQADSVPIAVVDNRDLLVENLAFCFMPNHIHLLLKQIKEGGISKFMQKFGAGYSSYFRDKYKIERKGHFFQGAFDSVHIKDDEQLKVVFVYIHTNPISLIEPNWKELGIRNTEGTIEFLENYKWSSYQDYLGKKNFPSVTKRDFLSEIMGGKQGCRDFVGHWVEYKGEIEFSELTLE